MLLAFEGKIIIHSQEREGLVTVFDCWVGIWGCHPFHKNIFKCLLVVLTCF